MIDKNVSRPIAFFIPSLSGGGAQRVVVNLANALIELTGHPVHVVLVRREGPFLEDLDSGIKVVELKGCRTILAVPSLVAYLMRWRPVVTMASMNYANITAVLAYLIAGKPGRLVLRETNVLVPKVQKCLDVRFHVMALMMRLCYRHANAIVSNSEDTLTSLKNFNVVLPANSQVIGNPITIPDAGIELGYRGPEGTPFICAVGRLTPQKGFDILMRAFAEVGDPDLHLVILGNGPLRTDLLELAKELGLASKLHLPGFINPPTPVLRNAKAFVLSSRWEGFGNVLVEALGCGLPIVATKCPGGPREILEAGRYGQLVPVDDVAALAKAIREALDSPVATTVSRKARANDYAPRVVAQKYLDKVLIPPA